MQSWSADGTRLERTGWRCEAISQRHRRWGFDCPAVDLDFVMAEYNHGKPVAIIEYKERHAGMPNLTHATYLALKNLADGRSTPIPFIVAFYDPVDWWFRIVPVNEYARKSCKEIAGIAISEARFVRGLYRWRKKVLTDQDERILTSLSAVVPSTEWN